MVRSGAHLRPGGEALAERAAASRIASRRAPRGQTSRTPSNSGTARKPAAVALSDAIVTASPHYRGLDVDTLGTVRFLLQAEANRQRRFNVPIAADYPFLDILGTMLVFFGWVIWFWLLITVFSDLFRRHDISGWGKTGWMVLTIVLPFIGVFIYLIAQGSQMAERRVADLKANQAAFDDRVRSVSAEEGSTGQIAKAKELLDSGAIDQAEFDQIKRKALA